MNTAESVIRGKSKEAFPIDYTTWVALSNRVTLEVRIGAPDLTDISVFDALANIERNVRSWIVKEPFSPKVLARDDPQFCGG